MNPQQNPSTQSSVDSVDYAKIGDYVKQNHPEYQNYDSNIVGQRYAAKYGNPFSASAGSGTGAPAAPKFSSGQPALGSGTNSVDQLQQQRTQVRQQAASDMQRAINTGNSKYVNDLKTYYDEKAPSDAEINAAQKQVDAKTAAQKDFNTVKGSIQNLLDSYGSLPGYEKGGFVQGLTKFLPNTYSHEYETSQRQGLAATLKSIAGAGPKSGVRTNQAELQNWSNLVPTPSKTSGQNQMDIISLDKQLKGAYGQGLDPEYLQKFGVSVDDKGKYTTAPGFASKAGALAMAGGKALFNTAINDAQDAGAGINHGLIQKQAQPIEAKAAALEKQASALPADSPQRGALLQQANQYRQQLSAVSAADAKNFSPDVNKNIAGRSLGGAVQIAGGADLLAHPVEAVKGVANIIRHPGQTIQGVADFAKNPVTAVQDTLAAQKGQNFVRTPVFNNGNGAFGMAGNTAAQEPQVQNAATAAQPAAAPVQPQAAPVQPAAEVPPNGAPAVNPVQKVTANVGNVLNGGGSQDFINQTVRKGIDPATQQQILQKEGILLHPTETGRTAATQAALDTHGKALETAYQNSDRVFKNDALGKALDTKLAAQGYDQKSIDYIKSYLNKQADLEMGTGNTMTSMDKAWNAAQKLETAPPKIVGKSAETAQSFKELSKDAARVIRQELAIKVPETATDNLAYSALKDYQGGLPERPTGLNPKDLAGMKAITSAPAAVLKNGANVGLNAVAKASDLASGSKLVRDMRFRTGNPVFKPGK